MNELRIIKQDYSGRNLWEYTGTLLERDGNKIVIEAYFDREKTPVDKLVLQPGDKFVETYFSDEWFNIYEIQEGESGIIKAWYCNITFPAEISTNSVIYRDLALDLLVYPDGVQKILDMDEFIALPIDDFTRKNALISLEKLQAIFATNELHFFS